MNGKEEERAPKVLAPSLFSNFFNFNVLYCTIKYYSVPKQYSGVPVRVNWNVTKYRCGSMRE